jgi:hypothetical protein
MDCLPWSRFVRIVARYMETNDEAVPRAAAARLIP